MSDINNKDIFDSIKKMVESEENASVLELTDMVTSDGKIVKVSKGEMIDQYDQGETDVGTFLKLMQNNNREKEASNNRNMKSELNEPTKSEVTNKVYEKEKIETSFPQSKIDSKIDRNNSVIDRSIKMENNNEKTISNLTKHFDEATSPTMNNDYIKRIVQNYVKSYLEIALPALVKKTVEDEVKNMLKNMM